MAYTEKRCFLSEENENDNLEIQGFIDTDGNSSAKVIIDIESEKEYFEIPLHKNALKGLIQELIKYL